MYNHQFDTIILDIGNKNHKRGKCQYFTDNTILFNGEQICLTCAVKLLYEWQEGYKRVYGILKEIDENNEKVKEYLENQIRGNTNA